MITHENIHDVYKKITTYIETLSECNETTKHTLNRFINFFIEACNESAQVAQRIVEIIENNIGCKLEC